MKLSSLRQSAQKEAATARLIFRPFRQKVLETVHRLRAKPLENDAITGTDWSPGEIDLIVADYFDMRRMELTNQPYVKAHHNARLREEIGRTRTSIEYKLQNISAVLDLLGQPWIQGYKPMANFQKSLLDGVERVFALQSDLLMRLAPVAKNEVDDPSTLFVGPPPAATLSGDRIAPEMKRLLRKFDPAANDERNRILGRKGELIVLNAERTRLISEDRADLAKKVRWVSEEDGDGAGYDILSYDQRGLERLVEVKTTGGNALTQFFISENERALSDERPEAFRLLRVYDALRTPSAFELVPPLQNWVHLQATNYRATFG